MRAQPVKFDQDRAKLLPPLYGEAALRGGGSGQVVARFMRGRELVPTLYERWGGAEHKFSADEADQVASAVGLATANFAKHMTDLVAAGVVSRRLDYSGGPRQSFVSLPHSQEDALRRYDDWVAGQVTGVPARARVEEQRGQKQALLRFIADKGGRLASNNDIDLHHVGTDFHAVVHQLWALQKLGAITFREAAAKGDKHFRSNMSDIRLTDLGWSMSGIDKPKPTHAAWLPPGPPPQNEKVNGAQATTPPAPPAEAPESAVIAESAPVAPLRSVTWVDPEFPLLTMLRTREAKITAAAHLLDEAGMTEDGIRVLEALRSGKIEIDLPALIREYMAFAAKCGQ